MALTTKFNGILSAFRFILGKTIVRAGVPPIFSRDADLQSDKTLAFF